MENPIRSLTTNRRSTIISMSVLGALGALLGRKARASNNGVTISTAGPAMRAEIEVQAKLGLTFVEHYLGKRESCGGTEIDEAIQVWRASTSGGKERSKAVVERVGALFGTYLASKLGLEWAVYTDARGEDLCVAHRKLSVVGFPHSAIYKAAAQGREQALPLVEEALVKQITEATESQDVKLR